MNSIFKNLSEVQEIDLKIVELEHSKVEFPKEVETLTESVKLMKNQSKDLSQKIDSLRAEKTKIHNLTQEAQSNLEKSQSRLNAIKTNREYDAIHAEIEVHKHTISTNEKRETKFSEQIRDLEVKLQEIQNSSDKITVENQPKIDELNSKIAVIDEQIQKLVSNREIIAADIPKPYMRAYEHIHGNRKNGKVLSIVNRVDRNCTVCYQMLQPQIINQMRRGSEIVYCQNCGSILVWQELVI